MKNFAPFRLRHTLRAALPLGLVLLFISCGHISAQDNTGNMPERAAPLAAGQAAEPMHMAPAKPKVRSTSLAIILVPASPANLPAGGSLALGNKTLNLTPDDLAAMPQQTITVTNGHTKASETYSGVPIAALLARLGLPFDRVNEHNLLRTYLVAEGTDGYRVLASVYETLGAIRDTDAIVADARITPEGRKPLVSDGEFKLVLPGDKRPQRWVQNLKSITFKTIE